MANATAKENNMTKMVIYNTKAYGKIACFVAKESSITGMVILLTKAN
jgi:hypothetical protein